MKQVLCRVTDNRTLVSDIQLLTLHAPELARALRPGQFALARDPLTPEPYLRRTLWLYFINGDYVAFTLSAHDALADRAHIGDTLDLLAPLGHAIDFETHVRHVLLVGDGANIAPLIAIAHDAIAREREVVLSTPSPIRDANERGSGVGVAHLLAPEIEYRADDGVNPELMAWADAIVASGSPDFYRTLGDTIRATRYQLEPGFARGLIAVPMPCGTGVCYACAVDTAHGVKLTCTDGAWFDLGAIENRRK